MAITVSRAIELIVDWTHEEILALERHLGFHPNRKPPEITITATEALAVAALQPQEQPVVQEIKTEIPDPETSPVVGDEQTGDHAEPLESPAPASAGDSVQEQHGLGNEGPEVGQ